MFNYDNVVIQLNIIMKKMGVLQLGLQISFWIVMIIVTHYISTTMSVIGQVA
jgi:hypothetical protein